MRLAWIVLATANVACHGDRVVAPAAKDTPSASASTVATAPSAVPPVSAAARVQVSAVVDLAVPDRLALLPKERVADGCARLVSTSPRKAPTGTQLRCGPEPSGSQPPKFVRRWAVALEPLLTEVDFVSPEIWHDEDTIPLHAHVVSKLSGPGRARLDAFTKSHPGARLAVVVGEMVEQEVDPVGFPTAGHFWITPSVPVGEVSNEEAAKSLLAMLQKAH